MQSDLRKTYHNATFDTSDHSIITAPVSGFARSFISGQPIENAKITVLENSSAVFYTDSAGKFGPIYWPVGDDITLVLEKKGFRTTQSATLTVPPEGLTQPYNNISFQVPSNLAYAFYAYAMGIKEDPDACQIATTVSAFNKTLDDLPQGEPHAEATICTPGKFPIFYFGIFKRWPLTHKTSPFSSDETRTTLDGGVAFPNVIPREEPYIISAKKEGFEFSKVKIIARKGVFINASPPHGPMVRRVESEK